MTEADWQYVNVNADRYNSIGVGAIRDFFGSLDRHKATKGLFVTTSTFSPRGEGDDGIPQQADCSDRRGKPRQADDPV